MKYLYAIAVCLVALCACEPNQNQTPPKEAGSAEHHLIYTKHALCRMDCRHIDESEILEILNEGNINARKSDENDKPCPTYAYEGYSHDNQHLRIVIARCDEGEKVITCIDLENEFQCDCK
jgi:hypothetical protein